MIDDSIDLTMDALFQRDDNPFTLLATEFEHHEKINENLANMDENPSIGNVMVRSIKATLYNQTKPSHFSKILNPQTSVLFSDHDNYKEVLGIDSPHRIVVYDGYVNSDTACVRCGGMRCDVLFGLSSEYSELCYTCDTMLDEETSPTSKSNILG